MLMQQLYILPASRRAPATRRAGVALRRAALGLAVARVALVDLLGESE